MFYYLATQDGKRFRRSLKFQNARLREDSLTIYFHRIPYERDESIRVITNKINGVTHARDYYGQRDCTLNVSYTLTFGINEDDDVTVLPVVGKGQELTKTSAMRIIKAAKVFKTLIAETKASAHR